MTILGISPSFFNILLGAGITIASTLAAWALLHFNQRRVDRDRTRRAIIHETDHIADNVEQLIDFESGTITEDEIDRVIVTLSPDVLEEDFQQINKLTSPEVRSIYEFYELTRVLKRKLQQQDRTDTGGERVKQIGIEIVEKREEIHQNIKRSRLSLFTEWYKERDRQLRNR